MLEMINFVFLISVFMESFSIWASDKDSTYDGCSENVTDL